MRFFDYIRLGLKNLGRQKSRTILTIIAITIGSLSLILMISLLLSVRQSLIDTFQSIGAFNLVTVTRDPNSLGDNQQLITSGNNAPEDEGKKIDDITLSAIKKLSDVADATPTLNVWAKTIRLEGQDKKMWASLMAYSPETDVFDIPIVAGRKLTNTDMDKIVVGWRFVTTYGFAADPKGLIGKRLIINYQNGGPGSAPDWGPLPEKPPLNADKSWWEEQSKKGLDIPAEIVGVADNKTMDDNQNYISLNWGKRLMTMLSWQHEDCPKDRPCSDVLRLIKEDQFNKTGYGSIIIKVDDPANLKNVASQIQKMGYGVTTAQDMIDQMNKIFAVIGAVLGVIGGISLFVAGIGIINTMVMATYERTREIGVMRACGATRATIRRLFTFEAALLGFWGGIFGILISFTLAKIARFLIEKYGADLGNIPIDRIGSFPWWLIVGVVCFTTILGMLAGLVPAIRAARLNPVDALRYE